MMYITGGISLVEHLIIKVEFVFILPNYMSSSF